MNVSATIPPPPTDKKPKDRSARIWLGCHFTGLVRMLARNRFRVHPRFWHICAADVTISGFNTLLGWVQRATVQRRAAKVAVTDGPLFIIGHWRTGTTLLQEMLVLDPRHTYPDTYQCLAPNHFLVTNRWLKPYVGFVLPSRRPMDNMQVAWDKPQEDEFALCNLGLPSPYWTIAFPNHPPAFQEYFSLEELTDQQRRRWQRALMAFVQNVAWQRPGRMVLKSPTHTFRLKYLREMFPGARFVHIVRNPYVVFPSTVHLWKSLYKAHGFQVPRYEGLEEYVLDTFVRMQQKLDKTRGLIDPQRFYELRYEDLVRDPVGELRALYDHLNLGDFELLQPHLAQYVQSSADYKTNRYQLSEELRDQITRRWGPWIERWGYAADSTTA